MQRSIARRVVRLANPVACLSLTLWLVCGPAFGAALDQARELIDAGDPRAAKQILENAISDPDVESAGIVLLTQTCNRLEEFEDGIRYGKRAIELLPESSEAHYRYAEALRIKMQKVNKMKAMFSLSPYKKSLTRAIELDPRNVEARREQIGYLTHAPGFAGGDAELALLRVDELMQIDWRTAMYLRAELETTNKKDDAAVKTYGELLEKHPDDAEGRFQLALLLQRLERFRDADTQFTLLTEHSEPVYAFNALYQMGRSRVLGDYEAERAVDLFQRYIDDASDELSSVPSKSNAYWRLGDAYQLLNRSSDARQAYERALALDRNNDGAKKALKALPSS